jgi:TatD DNase family protein
MLIDTHCHLEKAFARGDGDAVLERMQAAGVSRCITIGTGPGDWERYFRLAAAKPGLVDWTVGLHPSDLVDEWPDQVQTIATYFGTDPQPVALGEIGLDYFHLPKYPDEAAEVRTQQHKAFRQQLQLAFQFDCPVVVHSRNAVEDCIRFIDESGVNWERVVFHCWSDGPDLLEPILQRGGRASFTGILTYRKADPVREAARLQGIDRLMLETDAPYLAPEPVRGQTNEPAHVAHIARFAAEWLDIDSEELAARTTRNATDFFGLPPC